MKEKLGIFGGTFDPVHRSHIQLACDAEHELGLDRTIFLVAADPPHKPVESLTPFFHRVEMLQLVIKAHGTFAVSEIEATLPTPSYTIDTINHLSSQLGSQCAMYFIIGGDSFIDLSSWKAYEQLLRKVTLVVAARAGATEMNKTAALLALRLQYRPEKNRLRSAAGYKDIVFLNSIPDDISSSAIRAKLQAGQRNLSSLDPKVIQYIEHHNLYQPKNIHMNS